MSATLYKPITPEELKELLSPSSSEKQIIAAEKTFNLYNTAVPELNGMLDAVAERMYNPEKWDPKGVVEGLKKYDTSVHGRIATAKKDTEGDDLLGPVYQRVLADYSGKLVTAKNEALPFMWYMQNSAVRNGVKLEQAEKNIKAGLNANESMQKSLPELLKELDDIGTVKKG